MGTPPPPKPPTPSPLEPPPGGPYPRETRETCETCGVPRTAWDRHDHLYREDGPECPECIARAIAEDAAAVRAEDV